MNIENKKIQIGPFQVCPIPTGEFALDGGAMFGTVPKVLWEKSNPPDEKNRIPMEARALLLKSSDRKILIDTGNGSDFVAKYGEKMGTKFAEMYGVKPDGASLKKSLQKFGLTEMDITDVILTHLHFDHAGGATCERNGKIEATFPNARYYVQKNNLLTAQKPNIREKASYYSINFQPLIDSGQLTLLEGDTLNLIPGISTLVSNGHTLGQQMVQITDGTNTLLYCGDVIPTSSHVRLAWVMGYDLEPLKLIEEKQKVLQQATQHKWHLFFEHDPYAEAATVIANGSDFSVEQRFNFI